MARPRQFDEYQALDAAIRVFWTQGYEATSTEQLCTAVGLGRSSIYNTFTSKRELFLRALSRYLDVRTELFLETLESDTAPRERLNTVIQNAVETGCDSRRGGCLGVNSVIEMSTQDEEVDRLLRADSDRRRAALVMVIELAQASGEIDPAKDPVDIANFITATFAGLAVTVRSGADRRTLQGIADTAMSAL